MIALDDEFAVQPGDDDPVIHFLDGAVDDEIIAGEYPGPGHTLADGPCEICGGRVPDQEFVQIELFFDIIIRR